MIKWGFFVMGFLVVLSSSASAEDVPGYGDGEVRAVITQEGEIKYYFIPKRTITLASSQTVECLGGDVYETRSSAGEFMGYWIPQQKEYRNAGVTAALDQGWAVVKGEISPFFTPNWAYGYATHTGELAGCWLTEEQQGEEWAHMFAKETGWEMELMRKPEMVLFSKEGAIPMPSDDFIKGLSQDMLQQAKILACSSAFLPSEVTISATIGASAGIIVVTADGRLSFSITYKTEEICKSEEAP